MASKADARRFYKVVYELTFDVDAQFFYTNDSDTIWAFLKEKFWGEGLEIKTNLLCNLLNYDAAVNSKLKKDLKQKSKTLKQYLISPPQASDPPV